jgi:molybdopterin-containing oxidoreductase family membrane subunit
MATATQERGALTHPDVQTLGEVNKDIIKMLSRPGKLWWALFALASAGVVVFFISWGIQLVRGIGVSGLNDPVGWGVYITCFVFWVGIAHSGTLISAILFLFRAPWRQSVYRAAEAMTVFAVMTAGLFPLIHLGRM